MEKDANYSYILASKIVCFILQSLYKLFICDCVLIKQTLLTPHACDSDGKSVPALALEGDRTGMAASESQFEAVAEVTHYLLSSKLSQC